MKIIVCIGSSCHLKGARRVVEIFSNLIDENRLENTELSGTFCMGNCQAGVCVTLDGEPFSVAADGAEDFFRREILPRAQK